MYIKQKELAFFKQLVFVFLLLGMGHMQETSVSAAVTLPTLPHVHIDTTYSAPTGATCIATNSSAFQGCLNNAALNSTIVLQAGTTYTGPFRLPNKTSGSGWIYIISSNLVNLPAVDKRVGPSDAINMPKIIATTGGGTGIMTDQNAHNYRFVGIEFTNAVGQNVYNTITIGGYNNGNMQHDTSVSTLPTDITFDRCYVHGDETKSVDGGGFDIRGIAMDGIRVAVVDSYISNFKSPGADTQGLWSYNSPGPFKVENNFIEAAGENMMFGGADPKIANLVPSDIEVKRNYFFKRISWQNSGYVVKNVFEIKNGSRVLAEGNIFENIWIPSGQNGYAIVFTPRNQENTAPWSAVQDVTFRLNKVLSVHAGINLLGRDYPNTSAVTQRINVHDNLFTFRSGGGRLALINDGMQDFAINHNTVLNSEASDLAWTGGSLLESGVDINNNIVFHGNYGFAGDSCAGNPNLCLSMYYTNYTFTKNLIIGGSGSSYPANNYLIANNISFVGFVDYTNNNYHLSSSSLYKNAGTDGKDLGADIDALDSATACATDGQCDTPTPDTTPPTSPTNLAANAMGETSITVSWDPSVDDVGVVRYDIERCPGLSCSTFTQVGTTQNSPYTDSGLTASTGYSYHVRAVDAAGNTSGWSNVVSATTQPSSTPTSCSTITTPTTWNTINHTGYATPYDLFNNNTLIVQADCTQGSPTTLDLSIGNTTDPTLFSLMTGYYWDGSAWQSYTTPTCSGQTAGSWCQGETTGTITDTSINTSNSTTPQYFLGFTCKYTGSLPWKCGCQDTACTTPSWQLQGAALP